MDRITDIARHCEHPNRVKFTMRQVMRKTAERIRAEYVTDLLKQLINIQLGTNELMKKTENITKDMKIETKRKVIRCIMCDKLKDAYKELRTLKYQETIYWREQKEILRNEYILEEYEAEWSAEKKKKRDMYRERRKTKIAWMKNKYDKENTSAPEEYNGVIIKDQELTNDFGRNCKIYGNVEMDEKEKLILSLHPNHTVFNEVKKIECETEIEKAFTKLRWKETIEKNKKDDQVPKLNLEDAFDFEKQVFDFRKAKSTNLPFNSWSNMPSKINNRKEIQLQELKCSLMDKTEEYTKKHKNEMANLSREQIEGARSLSERINKKEIIVYQTDKSGKLSVDTVDNYIEASKAHFQDKTISKKEARRVETEINAHAVFWVRMLRAGVENNDNDRYVRSMRSHYSKISEAYTFRKDHKVCTDEVKGPPVRPLCNGSDSIVRRFSYLICKILREVNRYKESACDSTEDMLAAVRESNERLKNKNEVVLGSADVKALYPSLDIPFTINVVCQEYYNSKISFEGVDTEEMGLYLSLNRTTSYLKEKGLYKYCPSREENARGPKPRITASGIELKKEKRFRLWKKRTEEPKEEGVKQMMTESLRIALELILTEHVYIFNNDIKKQEKGGPIGLDITGEVAKVFMCWWDDRFREKLESIGVGVYLYKRYVDDINTCVDIIESGKRWNGRELVQDGAINDERSVENDKRTFEILRRIGDSIHTSIKLDVDVPSNHADNKLPILDLKMWIERTEGGGSRILHEFYIKEVASKFIISADAALTWRNKMTIITQQCLRILLNCSPDIEKQLVIEHMNYFMKRMQSSGYDQKSRYRVLRSAFNAYEKIKEKEKQNVRPMYRKKIWKHLERRREKSEKMKNWYKKGEYDSVMFIPATPKSELQKLYQEEIKKRRLNIKVVEKSGTKVKHLFQRNGILNDKQCGKDCFVCNTTEKGNCMNSGIVYHIECNHEHEEGTYVYRGRTMKNGYSRGKEHIDSYKNKHKDSVMWRHCVEKHEGTEQEFSMKIIDNHKDDAMKVQITEALRIRELDEELRMNMRNEWNVIRLPEVNIQ